MKYKSIIFSSIIILAFILSSAYLLENRPGAASSPELLITCDNKTIELPLEPNTTLTYRWIHSVEKTPIIEVYNVTPKGLILIRAETQSFGAGHPYSAEEFNGTFHFSKDYMVYDIHYNIGERLEILGNPSFNGTILVSQEGRTTTVCRQFIHGIISIKN